MAYLLSFSSLVKTCTPKASATAPPASAATSAESLDQKFGRKGIKFLEDATVELTVRNGSSLKLHIADAHVTSYKPKVYWKEDGFEEVLYTLEGNHAGGRRGGIALAINAEAAVVSQSENIWAVKDVDSDSIDAVQIELGSTQGSLDIGYVVTLYPLCIATAVTIKNVGRKPINFTSAVLSHFRFNKRNGAGVQGLKGCSYCTQPPLSSPFQILSPSEAINKIGEPVGLFSLGWEPEKKPGEWAVQDVPITVLGHKLSRVYGVPLTERSKVFHRSAPSKYEIIDQGRELFFRVIRLGFDEIYLSGPGQVADKYGKDYFICTGPASMLVPITLGPGQEWRGAQVIEHDNL